MEKKESGGRRMKIETQPWGGEICSITTIDGCIINVFK